MTPRQRWSEIFPIVGGAGQIRQVFTGKQAKKFAVKIHGNGSVIAQSRDRLHTEKCANLSLDKSRD